MQEEGPVPLTERNSGKFRFFYDERRFKGSISTCLVQQTLFDAGTDEAKTAEPFSRSIQWVAMIEVLLLMHCRPSAASTPCILRPGQVEQQYTFPCAAAPLCIIQVVCGQGDTPRQRLCVALLASNALLIGTCCGAQHAQHSRQCQTSRQGSWYQQCLGCTASQRR